MFTIFYMVKRLNQSKGTLWTRKIDVYHFLCLSNVVVAFLLSCIESESATLLDILYTGIVQIRRLLGTQSSRQ
jgi:hypothetical protein